MPRELTDIGSMAAADARAKVSSPADGKRLDVEGGHLEIGGIVDDENERRDGSRGLQPIHRRKR